MSSFVVTRGRRRAIDAVRFVRIDFLLTTTVFSSSGDGTSNRAADILHVVLLHSVLSPSIVVQEQTAHIDVFAGVFLDEKLVSTWKAELERGVGTLIVLPAKALPVLKKVK